MDETFKLKPGEELVLTVPKKAPGGKGRGGKKKKGPLSADRHGEYLPRRNRGGNVTFYDLSLRKVSGVYQRIDFRKWDVNSNNFSVSGFVIDGRLDSFNTNVYHDLLRAKIFEVAEADWKKNYKKLEFAIAEKFGVEFADSYFTEVPTKVLPLARPGSRPRIRPGGGATDFTKWKASGLDIGSGVHHFSVYSPQAFWQFDNNPAKFKITATPDYTAPAVPFTLAKNAEVYLVPHVGSVLVQTQTGPTADALFAAYAPFDRDFWANTSFGCFADGYYNTRRRNNSMTATEWNSIIDHVKSTLIPHAFEYGSPITEKLITAFPGYTFSGMSIDTDPFLAPAFRIRTETGNQLNRGRLVAVIHQGAAHYYFWTGGTDPGAYLYSDDYGQIVLDTILPEAPDPDCPAPTITDLTYPETNGLAPTLGSGIPTKIHRSVNYHIVGGYASGPFVPVQRQIQIKRETTVYTDQTRDFSFSGWGLGSYNSTFGWSALRFVRPAHITDDSIRVVYENGDEKLRVRDQYSNGSTAKWSPWAEATATWPRDYAPDGGDQAFLEANGYYEDES